MRQDKIYWEGKRLLKQQIRTFSQTYMCLSQLLQLFCCASSMLRWVDKKHN